MDYANRPAGTTEAATRTQAGNAVVPTVGSDSLLEHERYIYDRYLTSHEYIADRQSTEKGETLDKRIKLTPPLEERDVLRIVYQIAEGLAFIHDKYIEHGDITSKNILLIGDKYDVKIHNFTKAEYKRDPTKYKDIKDLGILMENMYENPKGRPRSVSKWIKLCFEKEITAKEVSKAFKKDME